MKFDQDSRKMKYNALILIAARDKNLKKLKYQNNILGNKFADLSR